MDDHQKKVLRWKRHLVAKSVKWTDDFVIGLKQRDLLLSDVILSQIQVRPNDYLLLWLQTICGLDLELRRLVLRGICRCPNWSVCD